MAEPYWADEDVTLHLGDCLDVLRTMEAGSVDAIVTDPPYGLEFMGREWDGADGFRRSLNEADTGRDNVFGRTSRTSPEYQTGRFAGAVTDRDFKGFVLSQQRTRNVKCPDCGKWAYDHPGRLCECGGIRRAQVNVFQAWCETWAAECLRVLKPGGWMLTFGGTRTWHRLTCAIEDAGFEVRDSAADLTGYDAPGLMWVYGSGFPKSLNVSAAIDKAAGAEREVIGSKSAGQSSLQRVARVEQGYRENLTACTPEDIPVTAPATPDAARWEGWGTALKPGWEPIAVARKPLAGTVAQNVLTHGTGALNVDGCRVAHASDTDRAESEGKNRHGDFGSGPREHNGVYQGQPAADRAQYDGSAGRWPPNVVLGPAAAAELDRQSGVTASRIGKPRQSATPGDGYGMTHTGAEYDDAGGASRFFPVFRYEAKAGTQERPRLKDGTAHPTVKPVDLMAWLVRLVTPPGGLVLDPFAGSGTTAEACIVEGFRCVLIEKDPSSAELIKARLRKPIQPAMFGLDEAS